MNSALDDEILALLRFAAEKAIMPRWRNLADDEVEVKAKDDPVTIADRQVEAFLSDALTRLAPGVAVVGEEAAAADPGVLDALSVACWIIDPIDGTSNFARGDGHFATMIALADGGEALHSPKVVEQSAHGGVDLFLRVGILTNQQHLLHVKRFVLFFRFLRSGGPGLYF